MVKKSKGFGDLVKQKKKSHASTSKGDKFQACFDANDFFEENSILIGSIAWEGFQEAQFPGIVLVIDVANASASITYIPRQHISKELCKLGVEAGSVETIESMAEIYEPPVDVIMVYVNRDGAMSMAMQQPEMPPPECYKALHKQA